MARSGARGPSRAIRAPRCKWSGGLPSSGPAASGGTLSDEQFLAWEAAGQSRRTQSLLGRSGPISGYLISVSVNTHLARVGLPMVTTPPPIPVFPSNPVTGLVVTNIDGNVSLQLQLLGRPGHYVLVFGARPQNPGVTYAEYFWAFLHARCSAKKMWAKISTRQGGQGHNEIAGI